MAKKENKKFGKVMREFYKSQLRSGAGKKVTSSAQAKAIAASEAGSSKKKKSGAINEAIVGAYNGVKRAGKRVKNDYNGMKGVYIKNMRKNILNM